MTAKTTLPVPESSVNGPSIWRRALRWTLGVAAAVVAVVVAVDVLGRDEDSASVEEMPALSPSSSEIAMAVVSCGLLVIVLLAILYLTFWLQDRKRRLK